MQSLVDPNASVKAIPAVFSTAADIITAVEQLLDIGLTIVPNVVDRESGRPHPIIKGWNHDSRWNNTTCRQFKKWSTAEVVGIVTGTARHRLACCDLDTKGTTLPEGAWPPELEPYVNGPDNFIVRSPSGGRHSWFVVPPELPLFGKRMKMWGVTDTHGAVDVLCKGAQVFVPPSIKPSGQYTVLRGDTIPTMPRELYDILVKDSDEQKQEEVKRQLRTATAAFRFDEADINTFYAERPAYKSRSEAFHGLVCKFVRKNYSDDDIVTYFKRNHKLFPRFEEELDAGLRRAETWTQYSIDKARRTFLAHDARRRDIIATLPTLPEYVPAVVRKLLSRLTATFEQYGRVLSDNSITVCMARSQCDDDPSKCKHIWSQYKFLQKLCRNQGWELTKISAECCQRVAPHLRRGSKWSFRRITPIMNTIDGSSQSAVFLSPPTTSTTNHLTSNSQTTGQRIGVVWDRGPVGPPGGVPGSLPPVATAAPQQCQPQRPRWYVDIPKLISETVDDREHERRSRMAKKAAETRRKNRAVFLAAVRYTLERPNWEPKNPPS